MPAYADRQNTVRPRERIYALAAVVTVQVVLAFVLLDGLRVSVSRQVDAVQKLIDISMPKPPPPPVPPPVVSQHKARSTSSAPKAEPKPLGGSPGPKPAHAPPSVTPIVTVQPTVAASGGGSGTGPALGSGAGGGTGGQGYGADDGGTDQEHIAGEIRMSDYPRDLAMAGIGGRVTATFMVETNGRATGCHVTRSSRSPELDALTCRIIEQRFRFRPSTDRYGRPIREETDWDHDWIPPRVP